MIRRRADRPGAELCTFVIGSSVAYLHSVVCCLRLQSARTGVEGWEESSTGQRPSILCLLFFFVFYFFPLFICPFVLTLNLFFPPPLFLCPLRGGLGSQHSSTGQRPSI